MFGNARRQRSPVDTGRLRKWQILFWQIWDFFNLIQANKCGRPLKPRFREFFPYLKNEVFL
jgi:hypothetical protein